MWLIHGEINGMAFDVEGRDDGILTEEIEAAGDETDTTDGAVDLDDGWGPVVAGFVDGVRPDGVGVVDDGGPDVDAVVPVRGLSRRVAMCGSSDETLAEGEALTDTVLGAGDGDLDGPGAAVDSGPPCGTGDTTDGFLIVVVPSDDGSVIVVLGGALDRASDADGAPAERVANRGAVGVGGAPDRAVVLGVGTPPDGVVVVVANWRWWVPSDGLRAVVVVVEVPPAPDGAIGGGRAPDDADVSPDRAGAVGVTGVTVADRAFNGDVEW
jgi:hypothetical protein